MRHLMTAAAVTALSLCLVVGAAAPAAAQQTDAWLVGGGIDLDGRAPGGLSLLAGRLLPAPFARAALLRFEGSLHTGERAGTSLRAAGGLQYGFRSVGTVRPYVVGMGGLDMSRSLGLGGLVGLGTEFQLAEHPLFAEARLDFGGFDASLGIAVGVSF